MPRDDLTGALYRVVFKEWAEHGFSAPSLARVAARARAGRAEIYHHFSSRQALADAALSALGLQIALP